MNTAKKLATHNNGYSLVTCLFAAIDVYSHAMPHSLGIILLKGAD